MVKQKGNRTPPAKCAFTFNVINAVEVVEGSGEGKRISS